jgi:TonB-linked SusC/RagA family outer membrane protein
MRSLSHRLLASVVVLGGLLPATLAAQQPTSITGRVTSADATSPIGGVAVSIPELRVGGFTDQMGRYTFTAPATGSGRTVAIVARRLGYVPDSVRVALTGGTVNQDFQLRPSATQLTGVVVTALGREAMKERLGTAQQQITSSDLNTTKALNVVQQVQGKVAGVNITGGGTPGGSVAMVIRGQNTLTTSNQPLFIVDGIPVSNYNRGGGLVGRVADGYDFGNAISDLNPEDIESFTVLKGPNAAAIYGSRAQNGAVVVTTKKGMATAGRMRTEITTLYSFDRPGRLPDFQDRYGQGAAGRFDYVNGGGAGICDGCDQSWGPMMDGRTTGCTFIPTSDPRFNPATPFVYDNTRPCRQFNALTGGPWSPHPDNVKDFFETGRTFSSTLAVSGGTDRANARMSVGMDNVDGFVPSNFFQKTTGLLSGNLQVTPRLQTNAVLQYVRNNGKNRPGTGYLNSIMEQFFWFGRQVDIDALKNWRQGGPISNGPANREFNWNYNYHNNPYYIQEANAVTDSRDRFIVQGTASYRLMDWLTTSLRTGSDIFRFNIDQRFDGAYLNAAFVNPAYQGGFVFINDYRNEHNTELLVNANRDITSNVVVNAMVGGNVRREFFTSNSTQSSGLSVAGIYNVSNAAITPTLGQFTSRRHMNSVFGSLATTLNGYWTVEATGRQDHSSTLPKGNNSYFYPSVNTSLILTDAVSALQNRYLSFVKLRASWAEVGNDTDPYQLATVFQGNANKFGGRPQFTLGNNLNEPDLKPEITRSVEGGVEVGFMDGRASLDLTLYNKETRNQIYLVPVSPTTGFANKLINAGKMKNTGLEALLTVTPVQLRDFSWTTTFNYGQNNNEVVELATDVERIIIGGGLFSDVRLEATKGKPYGAIWGGGYARCDSAAIFDALCTASQRGRIFTDGGYPISADSFVYHGSIQPKWTGGWNNTFNYKGVSLGALLDIRRGGRIASYTNYVGGYSGVLESSLFGREVEWNKPGVVFDGIDINTGLQNVDTLTSEEFHQGLFGNFEPYVYDASYVKLRELRFGYDLPQRWASRARMQAVSIALTGRNLALWTDVPNIDPEFAYSSGNYQGIEYALPGNTRSFGINVRLTP